VVFGAGAATGNQLGRIDIGIAPSDPNVMYAQVQSIATNNNSGGASGQNDFSDAIATAVINKRAGGTGIISGRKVFQRSMEEGITLLHAIQDVYLSPAVDVP